MRRWSARRKRWRTSCARSSNPLIGNLVGLAASIALPSVVLMMMYGQTRIFFVMARDGLLPERLSAVHPRFRTPYIVTVVTGIFVAHRRRLPAGRQAGRLFELGHLVRVRDGGARRDGAAPQGSGPRAAVPHPAVFIVAPLAIVGCMLLFLNLQRRIASCCSSSWTVIGLRDLFPLRLSPQPRRPRHHRSAGACAGRAAVDRHRADAGRAGARPQERD